jgi:DNA-binding NarL/FixJ family response regulator
MIRVVLADDQELVRSGFAMILDAQPDLEVIGEAGDGAEAVLRWLCSMSGCLAATGSRPRARSARAQRRR